MTAKIHQSPLLTDDQLWKLQEAAYTCRNQDYPNILNDLMMTGKRLPDVLKYYPKITQPQFQKWFKHLSLKAINQLRVPQEIRRRVAYEPYLKQRPLRIPRELQASIEAYNECRKCVSTFEACIKNRKLDRCLLEHLRDNRPMVSSTILSNQSQRNPTHGQHAYKI